MKSKIGSDWGDRGIPLGIMKRVNQLKMDESKLGWIISNTDSNTDFLMFDHFKGIISTNWEEVFSKIFPDQENTLKLKELEGIRNSIAHNRTLSNDAMTRLQQFSDDILNLISK